MTPADARRVGVDPLKLRRRPYLHVDPVKWESIRDQLATRPTPAAGYCQYDMRPGPERPPRSNTAVVEAAAFNCAVSGDSGDLMFLRTHLDMVLPSRGMPAIGVTRGQFLAACAFAHDFLEDTLDEPTYAALGRTLADHGTRVCDELERATALHARLEDPGLAATLAGLNLAGLALLPTAPDAVRWLEVSEPWLQAIFEHVAVDGWWPTGFEDWNALLPLFVRVADAWARLGGRDRFDHGIFRHAWEVALHGLSPGEQEPLARDRLARDELGRHQGQVGGQYRWRLEPCRWVFDRLSRRFDDVGFRTALVRWREAGLGRGNPFEVLWGRSQRRERPAEPVCHHVFGAHGVGTWRNSWRHDASWVALRTGPAFGSGALAEKRWQPATPVHADANHFGFWGVGEPLVIDDGQAHNTVLVGGQGQSPPHARRDRGAGLAAAWLSDLGGCFVGQAGGCYPPATGLQTFDRHLAFTHDYLVVWDVLAGTQAQRFDWLLHTPGQVEEASDTYARITQREVTLAVHVLRPGRAGHEVVRGEPYGSRLTWTTSAPVQRTQFLVVLAPGQRLLTQQLQCSLLTGPRTVGARLSWPDGDTEEVLFPTHDRGIGLPHLLADAAYLALRRRPDGDWRRLIVRRASRVLVRGGEVLTATQPVDLALVATPTEVRGELHSLTGATVSLRCPFVPRGVLVDGANGKARIERDAHLAVIRLTAGRHTLVVSGR